MLGIILSVFFIALLAYLSLAFAYGFFFVLAYYFYHKEDNNHEVNPKKIALIVPAHNEELIIGKLCVNLKNINYPECKYAVYIVSDNCSDETAKICLKHNFPVLERNDNFRKGKGYAIQFALENVELDKFDAVLIIDADTHVDENILYELSRTLTSQTNAIQCHIKIPNVNESWFTQLLSVARVMNGLFYHYPKSRFGLSSYLMGSGICFSTKLLKEKGWTAFSIAEDWEYYAQLILDGHKVMFAKDALVYQFESRSLRQATSQRLRWSSGRWKVTKTLGVKLLVEGLKKRNLILFDASLPLIFPNYSMQVNLAFCTLIFALLLPDFGMNTFCVAVSSSLLIGQCLVFIAGAFTAGSPWKTFGAAIYAPLFLIWKSLIDILCFTGLYRGRDWIRTKRHQL